MNIQALESEIAALPPDELARFGAWFDQYREEKIDDGEMNPEVEKAHGEEVLWRKEQYVRDRSTARPMNSAYFDEMRRSLDNA